MDVSLFAKSFLETLPDSVLVVNLDYQIVYANLASLKRCPSFQTRETLLGKDCCEVICSSENKSHCLFRRVASEEKPSTQRLFLDSPSYDSIIWDLKTFPVYSEDQQLVAILEYGRELTASLHLEKQLFLVDKMASIGAITSGVAHEINNPLGIILGYTQNLIALQSNPDLLEDLKIIEKEVLRCSKIIQDLMTFAKDTPSQKNSISLAEVVEASLAMVEYQMKKKKITLENFLEKTLVVFADYLQLHQMFLSLFLFILTHLQPQNKIQIQAEPKKHGCQIILQDNGAPLPKSILEGSFKMAFFTPSHKELFSLIVAKRIIEAHFGTFEIITNSFGTSYKIFLPQSE